MRRPRLSVAAVALAAPLLLAGCVGEADDDGGPSTVVTEREADNGNEPVEGEEADQDELGNDE